jgi:hypothetical protein
MLIVVARYNENVEWTKQFPNVIIYNKGKPLGGGYNELFMDNVGREGHTYYKYICDNYNNLPEHVVFLQGNPFDHSPNLIANLTEYISAKKRLSDFCYLSEYATFSFLDIQRNLHWQCTNIQRDWERVFGVRAGNHECIFGHGAQFIVSKKKILNRKKEFYENIVRMLEYSNDPLEGYNIERFHKYIFM